MEASFINKFNDSLNNLIKEIKDLVPENSSEIVDSNKFKDLENKNNEILISFYQNTKEVAIELSQKNEIVFSKDICLLEGIDFYLLWNLEINETSRESIWKYLHTMYLYADQASNNTSLPEIMKLYKKASKKQNLKVDKNTTALFGILDNICGNRLGVSSSKEELETRCKEDTNNESSLPNLSGLPGLPNLSGLPGLPDLSNLSDMKLPTESLFSGHIGQLATEIAGELDTSNLEAENPTDMIKNLLSGNMAEDSPVLKLVNQISSKIQNKLSSGEVNEMDLFKEAQGAMKMMGGDNKNSPFNMLHKMTESMNNDNNQNPNDNQNGNSNDNNEETITPDDIAKQMESILKSSGIDSSTINKVASQLDSSNLSSSNSVNAKRKQLKEKLKKKKQLLEAKRQMEKLNKTTE